MEQIHTWATRLMNRSLEEHAFRSPGSDGKKEMPRPGVDLAAPPALAFVNNGRWIAMCPCAGCTNAEYVDDRRPSFWCCGCRNVSTDHVPVRLVVPPDRPQIEAHLLARPDHRTRNWLVGEPAEHLHAENRQNGLVA
jgi:hypothetical protein